METILTSGILCLAIIFLMLFFLFRATLIYEYRERAKINMEIVTGCMSPYDKAKFQRKMMALGSPVGMVFSLKKWHFRNFYGDFFCGKIFEE